MRSSSEHLNEALMAANAAVGKQWDKFNAARGTAPHAVLVQIDKKLVRLEHERDEIQRRLEATS